MATAPSPNDLTRQQLDELDALLQRMLALPLNPPDGSPSPTLARGMVADLPLPDPHPPARVAPSPSFAPAVAPPLPASSGRETGREPGPPVIWRADPPAAPTTGPHLLTTPVPPPAEPESPAASRKAPPRPVSPPSASTPVASKLESPARPTPPAPAAKSRPTRAPLAALTPVEPSPEVPAATKSEPLPMLFVPLVALNRSFDGVCGLLGKPGRMLRSGGVKNLFGLVGLGLLTFTVAKVAQLHGWISLPISLPWPR